MCIKSTPLSNNAIAFECRKKSKRLDFLRHSRAVHWLKAGIDIVYLRDLMGHVSIQTTELYAKVDSKAKQDAIKNAWNCVGIVEPIKNDWEDKPKLLAFLDQFGKGRH